MHRDLSVRVVASSTSGTQGAGDATALTNHHLVAKSRNPALLEVALRRSGVRFGRGPPFALHTSGGRLRLGAVGQVGASHCRRLPIRTMGDGRDERSPLAAS